MSTATFHGSMTIIRNPHPTLTQTHPAPHRPKAPSHAQTESRSSVTPAGDDLNVAIACEAGFKRSENLIAQRAARRVGCDAAIAGFAR